jgi:hypothetical protein
MSVRESTSTSFWVPSVVPVGSFVITLDASPGFAYTIAGLINTAQWAILSSVNLIVRG